MDFQAAWSNLEEMINSLIASLPNLVIALIVLSLGYFLAKLLRRLAMRLVVRASLPPTARLVFGRLAQWTMMFIALLIALLILFPSFNAGQLIELLGIGGVAIGFAFRDIVQNFLAGILILLTQPFRINDQIIVGDYEGTVEDIQTRATYIKTYDGRRVVIPNSDLFTQSVIVNTAFPIRRIEQEVGIGYGDDIDQARRVILSALDQLDGVLKDPAPDIRVGALADFAVMLRLRWWSESRRSDVVILEDQVLSLVKVQLSQAGIDLPFPTHHILFHDQTETTDGDRRRQREGWPAGADPAPEPNTIAGAIGRMVGADN
ncbi:MAG: mechanosensitive ion channel family protein [Anaerolineales bacterium]